MSRKGQYYGQFAAWSEDDLEELVGKKLSLLPGHTANFSACTFVLEDEDHTLGNVLRYMIMKNPDVEFCGYSMPHPSEQKVHVRIQMYDFEDNKSALTALRAALDNLTDLFTTLREKYDVALDREGIDTQEPLEIDWEDVRRRKAENMAAGLLPGSQSAAPAP